VADRTGSGPREEALGALSWLWASCEKVSLSESDSLDRRLSRWERLMVNAHQLSCPACRRFRRQIRSLDAALARIRARHEAEGRLSGLCLPPDARKSIKAALRRANEPGALAFPGAPTD
jgi:predicted anti-sigma-YlaC factor YlaD